MDMALDKIVPEDLNWLHTDEGPEFVYFLILFAINSKAKPNLLATRMYCVRNADLDTRQALTLHNLHISVSHTKTALLDTSLTIPITGGNLNLGTWQGISLAVLTS
jgi:thiamine phosphate synthase YjbQ (UPF0047 family)